MTKELSDLAWRCLPKEFKEEVKSLYNRNVAENDISAYATIETLFGPHNLTSDAEGEDDETLYVSRKKLQYFYENLRRVGENHAAFALQSLFGSKCLPDKNKECSNPSVVNCNHKHGDGTCSLSNMRCHKSPKPQEPKFKRDDKVLYKGVVRTIGDVSSSSTTYHLTNGDYYAEWVDESDLKPYTEPKNKDSEFIRAESVKEARIADEETHLRNLSQEIANCDKHFDNILKDSFSKERRMNIAAQIMAAMISNPSVFHHGLNAEDEDFIIYGSLEFADTLIAECEKGGDNENN